MNKEYVISFKNINNIDDTEEKMLCQLLADGAKNIIGEIAIQLIGPDLKRLNEIDFSIYIVNKDTKN